MPIGMAGVSSCKVTVKAGQHVKKGAQIGHFQFGGSSHCLIFRPGVIKEFVHKDGTKIKVNDDIKVREMIAVSN